MHVPQPMRLVPQLQSPQPIGPVTPPQSRKHKPKPAHKPRNEISHKIENNRKEINRLCSKFRSIGGDRRLETKISCLSQETEQLQQLQDPPVCLISSHFNGNVVTYRINGRNGSRNL